jgi:NAD(P)-dependent dehydrogenase (short-subunit alcohol dehydrogenase family)
VASTLKVATITGAARGIGLATVKRFLADGWRVALLDIDEATLNRSVAGLPDPDDILAICCDVADTAGVTKAFAAIAQKFGRLDVLVNNADIAIFKPMVSITYEEWSRVLAVNLTGPFLCTQTAAPLIKDSGGGAIVNVTSISGDTSSSRSATCAAVPAMVTSYPVAARNP